ncbi:MAG: hypothetical protein IMHGJWDQ_000891 [Candidatus Fervidibacter sp.]
MPSEPVPERVAQGIREVLTMSDSQLATLPIVYDEWAHQKTARGFNPTMVRLLQNRQKGEATDDACFNPTMVRLLPLHL